jgi:hypothetical protein
LAQTYKIHKLHALQKIKAGKTPFIKYPSGNIPIKTSYNPSVYGWLWPTLFLYGVGMFEDPIHKEKGLGYSHIDLKPHVNHLLNLSDTHFQKHITFIYIMMNILQRKTSAYQSQLAFRRSWFPNVSAALQCIDYDTLDNYQSHLDKNPSALPENDSEISATELLKYVNYILDNISGSTAEINAMHQEL